VLKLRSEGTRSRQYFGGLLHHALQPTLGMLYAEAVGHTSYRSTWMCVSDGGHYDNLGLVEALQGAPELGITHIGLPLSRTCRSAPRFCATAALILGVVSGARSLSLAWAGSSSTVLTSLVVPAAAARL